MSLSGNSAFIADVGAGEIWVTSRVIVDWVAKAGSGLGSERWVQAMMRTLSLPLSKASAFTAEVRGGIFTELLRHDGSE
jgi:hypothetical protein